MEEVNTTKLWIMMDIADMTITADIKSAVKKGSLYMISRRNPMKNAATTAGFSKGGFAASLMNLTLPLRTGATAVTGLSRRGDVDQALIR